MKIFKIDFNRARLFYDRYERYLIPGALIFGVITDVILFRTVNITMAFTILFLHFLLSGSVIAFMHLYNAGFFRYRGLRLVRVFSPLLLQYSFGALLSGFLIFYWFSSSFTASWPFILIIVALMLSNDLLKRYYLWIDVQVGVYFFIAFSLSVLILPFMLESVSVLVFLIGGFLSLLIILLYIYGLSRFLPVVERRMKRYAVTVAVIFFTMNAMYFTNIIPPVPLNLLEAEVAYSVERVGGNYILLIEERNLLERAVSGKRVFASGGDRVFFFSSVVAPVWLGEDIFHHWQYYNEETGRWVTRMRVGFPIVGGREGGYRGFSFSDSTFPGRWRVLVENSRGQVIGKESFRVIRSSARPSLSEVVY